MLPDIVSPQEWEAARRALLADEKAQMRAQDALNAQRRRLPMVRMEKDYVFGGPEGEARLIDLFEGRLQLVVYHFMWLYDRDLGCPSCSGFADQIGDLSHLHQRGTTFACVSNASFSSIARFRKRMGWDFPWWSSLGSDFNYDFHVTFDESRAPLEYNYKTKAELEAAGLPADEWAQPFDLHGLSVFLRDGDDVFHTYSTYARGTDGLGSTTSLLDLTALGRQEEWEEPKGRMTGLGAQAGSAGVNPRYDDVVGS